MNSQYYLAPNVILYLEFGTGNVKFKNKNIRVSCLGKWSFVMKSADFHEIWLILHEIQWISHEIWQISCVPFLVLSQIGLAVSLV